VWVSFVMVVIQAIVARGMHRLAPGKIAYGQQWHIATIFTLH